MRSEAGYTLRHTHRGVHEKSATGFYNRITLSNINKLSTLVH